MSTTRIAGIIAGLAALALVAAGCGDDDGGGEEPSGPALTKAEFIAEADAICTEKNAEVDAALAEEFGDLQSEPPVEEQRDFLSTVLADNFESQLNAIRGLNPPEADADTVNEVLSELDALVDLARDDPDSLISGDAGGNQAQELAQAYGFTVCGNS